MKITCSRYSFPYPKAQGFRLAQVSDLHNTEFQNDELISLLKREAPNIIAVTGDLLNRHRPEEKAGAMAFFKAAVRLCPVYCIEGNHETAIGSRSNWRSELKDLGVIVLDDAFVELDSGCGRLRLVGCRERTEEQGIRVLQALDHLTITLSHRPERIKTYAAAGCRLVLCGHAHGGQMRPFNLPLFAPEQGVFPKYTKGVYTCGETTMIVSAGIGNTVKVPRLWNPPEIAIISLQ
ncbi:MAG: metallophosphoesterase [Clostridia bacterium]|nr:metallophosphoesterase [Clostridia bacterium]